MKRWLLALLILPSPLYADAVTSGNVGLLTVSTGIIDPTGRSWGDKYNENFRIIASTLGSLTGSSAPDTQVWSDEGGTPGANVTKVNVVGPGSASQAGTTVTLTLQGGNDNLGSHVATQTVTIPLPYGLSSSTGIYLSSVSINYPFGGIGDNGMLVIRSTGLDQPIVRILYSSAPAGNVRSAFIFTEGASPGISHLDILGTDAVVNVRLWGDYLSSSSHFIRSGNLALGDTTSPTSKLDVVGGSLTIRGDKVGLYVAGIGSASVNALEIRGSTICYASNCYVFPSTGGLVGQHAAIDSIVTIGSFRYHYLIWGGDGGGVGGSGQGGGGGFTFDGVSHVAFSTITILDVGVLTSANNVSSFTLTASTLNWRGTPTFLTSMTVDKLILASSGIWIDRGQKLIIGTSDYSFSSASGIFLVANQATDNAAFNSPVIKFFVIGDDDLGGTITQYVSSMSIGAYQDASAPDPDRIKLKIKNIQGQDVVAISRDGLHVRDTNNFYAGNPSYLFTIGKDTMIVTSDGYITVGTMTVVSSGTFGTLTASSFTAMNAFLGGTTIQGVLLLGGSTIQVRNGTNEFSVAFATALQVGILRVVNVTGNRALIMSGAAPVGSPITIGDWNTHVTTSDLNFQTHASTAQVRDKAVSIDTTTLANLISDISVSTTIIFNQESPNISNRTYFLHNESSGGAQSFYLMLSSPSQLAGTVKSKSIASADGLVLISSHITLTGDPGVRKIPAGEWSFTSYLDVSNIAGITQMVIVISTIDIDGSVQSEVFSSTSPDLDDLGAGTRIDQFYVQPVDITMTTATRITARYYARTSNALAVTFELFYGGPSSSTHLNTPISNVYKFTDLSDTPATLLGQAGKYLSVNNDQTATVFVSSITDAFNTRNSSDDLRMTQIWAWTSATTTAISNATATIKSASIQNPATGFFNMNSFGISGSSALTGGQLLFEGSATVRGVLVSSTGFQVAASTVQGSFMLEGGSIQVRNGENEFTIVFATGMTVGQKLIVASKVGNRHIIASGIDNVGAAGTGYSTIQEEGTGVAQQTTLNFIGASVIAEDDPGNNRTNVTITGGGSGGSNGLSISTGSFESAEKFISSPTANIVLSSGSFNVKSIAGSATAYIEIGTNTAKDFGRAANLRFSSTTGKAMWDTPSPREFVWSGYQLSAISTGNSTNIAPIVKTTGTVSEIISAMYPSSACRGGNFQVPAYADPFSTPTFTAIWFTTNPVAGNVVWNLKYSTGMTSGDSWDVKLTTVVAATAANNTGGRYKTTQTSWQPAGVGGFTGRGTMQSMGWDGNDLVDFLVCREQNIPSDGDTLSGPLPFLMSFKISVPMQ